MVLVAGGAYAEYVAVHMGCAIKIPQGISMVDAAGDGCFRLIVLSVWQVYIFSGIPEAFLTAFQGLRFIGNLQKNNLALIHAGAR